MSYQDCSSVVLHQQQGGMSLADFAALHAMSVREVQNFAAEGKILGANQDSRSNRWTIYPPAKLLVTIKRRNENRETQKRETPYTARQVIQAERDLKLVTASQPVRVLLSGAQALLIEIALHQFGENLKCQREKDTDYEQDFRVSYGDKLNNIYTALTAFRNAAREASSCCGKLPAAAWPQAAQPGFPTATTDRSSDLTEAQAGARRGALSAMGIPEGGKSPAPSECVREEPAFSLPGAFAFDVVHTGSQS